MPRPTPLPESFFSNLHDASSWDSIVPFLTNHLRIPDLSTSHGLRKAYSRIDRLYDDLCCFHELGKSANSPQLLAGVVSILIKMSADALLKEKLFERGLINQIMDLLDHDLTRGMALQLLLVFTYDGCRAQDVVLKNIARRSGSLFRMVRDRPNEPNVTELAVVVIAHSARYLMSRAHDVPDDHLHEMSLNDMMDTMKLVLHMPYTSKSLLTHALMSLVTPVQYIPEQCNDNPSLKGLLVALLRVQDIHTRTTAIEAILTLYRTESDTDKHDVDLERLAVTLERPGTTPPSFLGDMPSQDYARWLEQSESSILYHSSIEYIDAMSKAAHDQDLAALGRTVAGIVRRSPAVVEGSWQQLERSGIQLQRRRLPFSRWSDTLPECAKILRRSGARADQDAADVLDMKYLMLRDRVEEAVVLAKETITRDPTHVYAHYVVSLCGDMVEGFQAATQGLKCATVTPFLRKQMLWRAVECGVSEGLEQILTADEGDICSRDKGVAFLRAASENAKTFLIEAAPDAPLRLTMLGWSLLLTFVLRGPELSDDLRELEASGATMPISHLLTRPQPTCHDIDATATVMAFFGYTHNNTRLHKARSHILDYHDHGLHEWRSLIKSCDDLHARTVCQGEGLDHPAFVPATADGAVPDVYLGMQRCSWCGALSAALKQCRGCGTARQVGTLKGDLRTLIRILYRYCDAGCQRPHWEIHRQSCRGRRTTNV
ncbi:hypothetical protein K466DRAFT_500001 [Polyporus arcularius HHB13444]|uniref:Uncharacterized protein n=1 Tax=Polyporus arcularius HHB13444 TaxID=1314778 RepID=A0A5C3P012_9APHY|nr:hypothetical protein K466DRAFT_500001 [Polyporus arcularius HHB13444]